MSRRPATLLILVGALIVACSCPLVAGTGLNPLAPDLPPEGPPTSAAPITVAPPSTSTSAVPSATTCTAQLTANSNVNVRNGPGTNFNEVGGMTAGQSAAIDGKNSEGTWWYIVFASGPGGHGWVSASVTTATCVPESLAVIVVPVTPTVEIPLGVTDVSVSVDPKEIHVGGCMGPVQPSTAYATITVNGPITIKWHFETDQHGALPNHTLVFNQAGSKSVSEGFTPLVEAGTFRVELVIENMDLGGMDFRAKYKIVC